MSNIKNIFQMIRNRNKNKQERDRDIISISIDDNNKTIITERQNFSIDMNMDIIYDEIDHSKSIPSFMSDNSISNEPFDVEYHADNTLENSCKMIIDSNADNAVNADNAEKNETKLEKVVSEVATNAITSHILKQIKQKDRKVLFNIRGLYNVLLDFSDIYWLNYQNFHRFWNSTIGPCNFLYNGSLCTYEEIVLHEYDSIIVI
jgi:hypothetical protein